MKGHASNTRYRLKTKTVHGVRTGEHNNPHVMKAAARADGGMCEGMAAPPNLGKMGRMRKGKEDGGSVSDRDSVLREADKAGERAGADAMSTAGIAGLTAAMRKMPGIPGRIMRGIGLGGTALGGGATGQDIERERALERKARGMPLREEKDGGPVGRKDGGSVSEVGAKELKQHALEHKAMAEKS